MAEKTVDLDATLYDVTEKHPELVDVLFGLGFMGVKNPAMRTTHGRQMTLRAGCDRLGIDREALAAALRAAGYAVKR